MNELTPTEARYPQTEHGGPPVGIGGWLILPLLGLFLTPITVGVSYYRDLIPVMTEGYWGILTDPASDAYDPLWAPMLLFELIGNPALVALNLVALVLFLRKSRFTPRLMITLYGVSAAFMVADELLGDLLPVSGPDDPALQRELIRSLVTAAIWIPYFLVSKRVKATFVR